MPTPTPTPGVIETLKDVSDIIINVLAILGSAGLLGGIGWLVRRWWRGRQREKSFPWTVITDPRQVLPALLPGRDILADHAIPYQQRQAGRDTQLELRAKLRETGCLLVTGPTCVGSSRARRPG